MTTGGQGEKQRYDQKLDREIREMISALTRRLGDMQKQPTGGVDDNEDDDHGVRIITMAGTNVGAMMRGEINADLEEKDIRGTKNYNSLKEDLQESDNANPENHPPPLTTYLNSNFQAINNSIMFGGSYTTNDPGIHLDVSDYYINPTTTLDGADHKAKHPKKPKRKSTAESSSSKTDHHSSD